MKNLSRTIVNVHSVNGSSTQMHEPSRRISTPTASTILNKWYYQTYSMRAKILRPFAILLPVFIAMVVPGCGPAHYLGNVEIPTAKELGAVMWSLAELADPAFKKIAAPAYLNADWAAFTALGQRLQITSVKIKKDFSKGDDWNNYADALSVHAKELVTAAEAKDSTAASAALTATRATCRACHKEFR